MRQHTKSAIRAIGVGANAGGFRSNPLARVLVVVAATIVVLILSAIVLPPEGSQAGPGESGEAPISASH